MLTYKSPPSDFATLVRKADGSFERRLADGTIYLFDANGLQTSIIDRNGNTISFGYDASDRLTTITDMARQ